MNATQVEGAKPKEHAPAAGPSLPPGSDASRALLDERMHEIAVLARELVRMQEEVAAARDATARLRDELAEVRDERDNLMGEAAVGLKAHAASLEVAWAENERVVAAMRSSTSWRVTAPLRAVSRRLGRS